MEYEFSTSASLLQYVECVSLFSYGSHLFHTVMLHEKNV